FQQRQRNFNRGGLRIWQFRPAIFRVGLNGRFIFGERQFKAYIRIQVAVWHVMHDLAYSPAAGPIWRLELSLRQSFDRRAQLRGGAGNVAQRRLLLFLGEWPVVVKFADGIAQICHRFSGQRFGLQDEPGRIRGSKSLMCTSRPKAYTGASPLTTTPSTRSRPTPSPPASNFDSPGPRFGASKDSSRLNSHCCEV